MLHLDDASTCKKHDLNTNMKINRILKTFLHKYNKCFTESVQKYLNEKSFKASNFSVLPKTHKSKKIEAALHSQKTGTRDSRTQRFETETNFWWGKLSNKTFLDTILQPYLKHIKSYSPVALTF